VCLQDGREEGGGRARNHILLHVSIYIHVKGKEEKKREKKKRDMTGKEIECLSKPCRLSLRVASEAGEIAKHGRGRESEEVSVCLVEVRKEVGRKGGRANRGRKTCRGEACTEDRMGTRATPKNPPRLLENRLEERGRMGEREG